MTGAGPATRALGILPALGSGLTDLRRGGQDQRLLAYDLRHYAAAYDQVSYFSYYDESLAEFTTDPVLLGKVRLLPRRGLWPPKIYALLLPLIHHQQFRRCEVLRVMQFSGVIPALVARLLYGTPFVVTYGYHYAEVARISGSRIKPLLYRWLEALAFPLAAGVIVTSREIEASLCARPRNPRVAYFPNGVDVRRFAPSVHNAPPRPRRTVLYVGRLEQEKNVLGLIDAIALIRSHPVRLVLVGDGSLRAELGRRARATGVDVELRGVVPYQKLPRILAGADVFVLPSFTEGHAKALTEAMACGLPCAASARGGNLALLEDGVAGLLFDPEEPPAIARTIERLLTDEALARRLGAAARDVTVARFDIDALLGQEVRFVQAASRGVALVGMFDDYAEQHPMDDALPEFVAERLRELGGRSLGSVLDLGAGDGRYLELFSGLMPDDALVVGCEISLRRARRIKAKGFRVVVAQSEALPFRAGAFDLVAMLEVIEHTQSPARSLDETRRVLRRGGRLVLTTPNYPIKRLYDVRQALRYRDRGRLKDDPTHISPLSARRLERLLRGRFESVSLEGTTILGESRSAWLKRLRGSRIGRALSHKLFAVCGRRDVAG